MRKLDLVGKKFGRLTVVEESHSSNQGWWWLCKCECGVEKKIAGKKLPHTQSCGCFAREETKKRATTHGMRQSREHAIWCGIKTRCTNPKSDGYKIYGGRGITICKEWSESFEAFFKDMGERPSPKASIDRIDPNLGYYKENCRWATMKEQNGNRRNNKWLSYKGEKKILQDWSVLLGVDHKGIEYHLNNGRSFEWVHDYFKSKK